MKRYMAVFEALRKRIEAGEWAIGEQLPPIAELQRQYDVRSLSTVRAAQQLLVSHGMLETHQGVGAFVRSLTRTDPAGPVVTTRVALGLRLEFYGADDALEGALLREDVIGVAVPCAGDALGPGSLSDLVHQVVGHAPLLVDHVDHYLHTPASNETSPLAIVVCRVAQPFAACAAAEVELQAQGWMVNDLRHSRHEVTDRRTNDLSEATERIQP